MNRLHETQRDFSRYVLQNSDQIPAGIKANGIAVEQRLNIYRNNTRLGLTEVLREVYPVVNKLVGDAFFNRLAQAYINLHPSKSACLLTFGGRFSEVIAGYKDAQGLAYLPDTARLEWYVHEAYHAADDSLLDVPALAQLDAESYQRLGFKVHLTGRFIASDYPIGRIWIDNQCDARQESLIDLTKGGCCLLIFRPELEVGIVSLNYADYQCLTALASGLTLIRAVECVIATHPDFDIQPPLKQWLQMGLLTDFFIL
ncbi:MAG: DNA-binding domain-containing protein [Methylococcales bacterium]|nr:DNA-binding domain-containing protein [Methylococcales bacterium]